MGLINQKREGYPEEVMRRFAETGKGVVRLQGMKRALRSAADGDDQGLTFQETERPIQGKAYDSVEIEAFTLDHGELSVEVLLSLKEKYPLLRVSADIINHRTQTLITSLAVDSEEDTYQLHFKHSIPLTADIDKEDLTVVAYASWGTAGYDEQEVVLMQDYGSRSEDGTAYHHLFPKKETSYITFPRTGASMEGRQDDGKDYGAEKDYIVIALYRKPDKTDDLDYLCLFDNKNSKPYIGVPGEGEFRLPQGSRIITEGPQEEPWAECTISPIAGSGGGKMLVAASRPYSPLDGVIQVTALSDTHLKYDMTQSWGVNYQELGNWNTNYFDYRMEVKCYLDQGGEPIPWMRTISSKKDAAAIFHTLPIAIKYGCFARDTLISMADGSRRCIQEVKIGELIYTENGTEPVSNIWRGTEKKMVKITAEDGGMICVTEDHPLIDEETLIRAGKVTAGSSLRGKDGMRTVKNVELLHMETEVYNLDAGGKMLYAEDFASGDFILQNS